MEKAKELLSASLDVGLDLLGLGMEAVDGESEKPTSRGIVPIRSLGENHKGRILSHLLSLERHDRYLRFGYVAQDAQIEKYVESLDFSRDDVFGIYDRHIVLLAVAHLAYSKDDTFADCAEFGVSVLQAARGRGYGKRLFERAAMHASNDGVRMMFIHALSENAAMLSIARQAGATIERDGTESEAFLALPRSSLDTQVAELIEEGIAQTDYRLKLRARQFRHFMARLKGATKPSEEAAEKG